MSLPALPLDTLVLYLGAVALVAAAVRAWRQAAAADGVPAGMLAAFLLVDLAMATLTIGLAMRWARLGHGPFLGMFEILGSSLLSLALVWRLVAARVALVRESAPVVLTLLGIMSAWLLATEPRDTILPATYEMPVLWFHVLLGKIFLGCALVATGLAGVLLARRTRRGQRWFRRMPNDAALDYLAWRFMLAALVFESLMLIAGAVWAQDAWGRYWAWDPLETWAFITWLALAAAIHARITWRVTPRTGALLIAAVFVLAFLTFFGVPFVSTAPHKGAV
jgi:ABC-type transport system involved in cytochrome c biogenesis permease subunit